MDARLIAVPVALQRYVDAPPLALRQRDVAAALALATHARVLVVTVESDLKLLPQALTLEEKLETYAHEFPVGVDVETRILHGKPSDVVVQAIESAAPDLVVAGTHSKRSTLDVALGSTASSLTRLSVPLVLLRPTHDDEERARAMMVPHEPVIFAYL